MTSGNLPLFMAILLDLISSEKTPETADEKQCTAALTPNVKDLP
jgi:hypothetical protein